MSLDTFKGSPGSGGTSQDAHRVTGHISRGYLSQWVCLRMLFELVVTFNDTWVNVCVHYISGGYLNNTCVLLPLYLLSDHLHPPPLPKLNVQYIQAVCDCGGGGGLNCTVDHILQELYTLL